MRTEVAEKMQKIAASRARKIIQRSMAQGSKPDANLINTIIQRQTWIQWGYESLLECLRSELGIAEEQAQKLTAKAIEDGYEDGQRYRTN